jgi:hypothetical protein
MRIDFSSQSKSGHNNNNINMVKSMENINVRDEGFTAYVAHSKTGFKK